MNLTKLLKATVSHESHDEWLCYASFTPDLLNRALAKYGLSDSSSLDSHYGMKIWGSVGPAAAECAVKPDFSKYYADMEIPDGAFINALGVLEIPTHFYHFTGYVSPLRNTESMKEIESFPFETADDLSFEHMKGEVERRHAEGVPVAVWVGHLYESAWQIRGYEEFLADMLVRPEFCECILDRICERNVRVAQEAARAGVDLIRTGDDVASQVSLMFSPDIWRKFIKSRWKKIYEAARSINPDIQIWYHSDGNIMEIIPELIDIGVTILNPVQPECMDIAEVKRRFGKQLVLDGTIGTQSVMPFGSPDDVRATVRRMKQVVGSDGALILSPTHVLEPEVPLENIEAFFEECGAS